MCMASASRKPNRYAQGPHTVVHPGASSGQELIVAVESLTIETTPGSERLCFAVNYAGVEHHGETWNPNKDGWPTQTFVLPYVPRALIWFWVSESGHGIQRHLGETKPVLPELLMDAGAFHQKWCGELDIFYHYGGLRTGKLSMSLQVVDCLSTIARSIRCSPLAQQVLPPPVGQPVAADSSNFWRCLDQIEVPPVVEVASPGTDRAYQMWGAPLRVSQGTVHLQTVPSYSSRPSSQAPSHASSRETSLSTPRRFLAPVVVAPSRVVRSRSPSPASVCGSAPPRASAASSPCASPAGAWRAVQSPVMACVSQRPVSNRAASPVASLSTTAASTAATISTHPTSAVSTGTDLRTVYSSVTQPPSFLPPPINGSASPAGSRQATPTSRSPGNHSAHLTRASVTSRSASPAARVVRHAQAAAAPMVASSLPLSNRGRAYNRPLCSQSTLLPVTPVPLSPATVSESATRSPSPADRTCVLPQGLGQQRASPRMASPVGSARSSATSAKLTSRYKVTSPRFNSNRIVDPYSAPSCGPTPLTPRTSLDLGDNPFENIYPSSRQNSMRQSHVSSWMADITPGEAEGPRVWKRDAAADRSESGTAIYSSPASIFSRPERHDRLQGQPESSRGRESALDTKTEFIAIEEAFAYQHDSNVSSVDTRHQPTDNLASMVAAKKRELQRSLGALRELDKRLTDTTENSSAGMEGFADSR